MIISILIVSAQFLIGQNIPFDKTNFSDKEGLKAALKNIQEGDAFYFSNIYSKALEKFSEANTFNPKNAELNSKIGDCYLHTGEYKKAQNSLEKAYQLNPDMDGFFLYLLGKTYHVNNNFESAIDLYKKAKSKGSKLNSSALESASSKTLDFTDSEPSGK